MPRLPCRGLRDAGRRGAAVASLRALVLGLVGLAVPSAAQTPPEDLAVALRAAAEMRLAMGAEQVPVGDAWQELTYLGRPAIEIKGRVVGADGAGRVRDFSLFDRGTGRIVTFVWFPNASARRAGEAILPMSEASARADALLRRLAPARPLALESIERYRASGLESVYYEVRYAAPEDEIRFLKPPVRLLLDASTGRLFRYDLDPEWISPPPAPRARVSGKAAERIAAVALASRDLSPVFGPGAAAGKPAATDVFYARPNGWLGLAGENAGERPRAVWLVSVPVTGAAPAAARTARLYVDASSGRVVGGEPDAPP